MRLNGVAGKAMVVIAMALVGWVSPATADPREVGCNEWFCVDLPNPPGCSGEPEIEEVCGQVCPHWHYFYCYDGDTTCEVDELELYCAGSG